MATSTVDLHGPALRLIAAAIAVAAVTAAAPSAAAPAPAPPVPAIQQYVEQLPTSGGSIVTGSKGSRKLPPALERKIDTQAGVDAAPLKAVASSAAYGAPQHRLARDKSKTAPTSSAHDAAIPSGGALSAAAGSLSEGDSHTLAFVVAAAFVTALAGAVVALRRRRS